jgi:hypothetical protein
MEQVSLRVEHWNESGWLCALVKHAPVAETRGSLQDRKRCPRGRVDGSRELGHARARGLAVSVLLAAVLVGGCAGREPLVIREPVGPAQPVALSTGSSGSLVVYSGWDRLDTLDSEHPKHTPYSVHSETDGVVAQVSNHSGSFGQDPSVVSLAPGRYWVHTRGTNVGLVRVPVTVRAGQRTVVYLDGSTAPVESWRGETNWLRQPNGLIVGWRDQDLAP